MSISSFQHVEAWHVQLLKNVLEVYGWEAGRLAGLH